jgi:hypothetical protein|tara:strand:+ start:1365 stop:1574 length:210 start_codon:yes stop_codon:yes gene_type:complete
MKKVIYPIDTGIAVIHPVPDHRLTIEELAKKNVPTGVKFRIIEHTDLPNSREFRNAWEANFSTSDGVGT